MQNISEFEPLIQLAQSKLKRVDASSYVSYGQVAAAIETVSGSLFVGVCIDSACSIGMRAERNAIDSMLTEGEHEIKRLACIKAGEIVLPCGVCREFLMQLHPSHSEIEILTSHEGNIIKLSDLIPNWWGIINNHQARATPSPEGVRGFVVE